MDTDMTKGYEMKKIHPRQVAEAGLTGHWGQAKPKQ